MQIFVGDTLGFTPGNFAIDPGASRFKFQPPQQSGGFKFQPPQQGGGFKFQPPQQGGNGIPTADAQVPPSEWRNANGDFNAGVVAAPAAENPFGLVTSMINHLLGGAGKQFDDPSAWLSNYWLEYE